MDFIKELEYHANQHPLRRKVEEVISKCCWHLLGHGIQTTILNERYLIHEGKNYQLIRNRKDNKWIAKEWGC